MIMALIIAGKEFRDGLRNRWVLAITLVFAVLAVGLSYFGAAASGTVGFTGLGTTIVSLASLAVLLVPLIALFLAYDSIIGEDEQGTLLLLLSYPISRGQLLTGKLLGHGSILAVASVLGFGCAALVIVLLAGDTGVTTATLWLAFAQFIGSAVLLGLSFIAMAYLISVTAGEKSQAAGLALIVWFVIVMAFDMALLGVLVVSEGAVGSEVLPYLLLFNPTDVFRLINLSGFEATRAAAGLLSIADGALLSLPVLFTALVAWIVIPFLLAQWLFARREL